MRSDALASLIPALTTLGGQRVWSLIISVLGDLAQETGSFIEGPALSAIMAEMDVKPEAVRVALHRLRNDGWITSEKSGRTSKHSLTPHRRAETLEAARRIYAEPKDMSGDWHILLTDAGGGNIPGRIGSLGYVSLTAQVYIGSGNAPATGDAMILRSQTVPDWLKAQLTREDLKTDYRQLYEILTEIDEKLPEGTPLVALEVAVLRCLIVHNWRRLVLKHADLPAALYTSDWKEHACRARVSVLLKRFPKPSLADLTE